MVADCWGIVLDDVSQQQQQHTWMTLQLILADSYQAGSVHTSAKAHLAVSRRIATKI